jgi:hypothetical protein
MNFTKEEILKSFIADMGENKQNAVNENVWNFSPSSYLSTAPPATSYYANSIQ